MKFTTPVKLHELTAITGGKAIGVTDIQATGINEIHKVEAGDISYVDHPKYYSTCLESAATVILINKEVACPEGKVLIVCEDPFNAYNAIVRHFFSISQPTGANIHPDAKIGANVQLFPGVFIGEDVTIGDDCILYPNVCIYPNTVIGNRVIIHAQTTIGSDAFYYKKRSSGYDKMISCGKVIIEDDVEIGASCTIDRGVSHETRIGEGTKIDNHVHIGHDTIVGKHCLFAAQVGIAGVVTIGDHVTLWGQVGVPSKITIGDHAVVLAQSGLLKSVSGHQTYFGSPAEEAPKKMRELIAMKQLPDLIRKNNKP
ncbi:MAG: UDP-3-O-(3-hydroxymyristoyl)glucosamine N-acyltransferase [Flavobacteriales bacterium]|nr:UDP-3-O-(3-hydroxymyristoyl)glucosamine N-acyltransferase [Flavobacteriales bacterium]